MKKRIRALLAAASAALFTAAAVTACGSGSGAASSYAVAETAAATMDFGARAKMAAYDYVAQSQTDDAEAAFSEFEEETTAAGAAGLTSSTAVQPVSSNRKLIRTVNLSVETTDFDPLISNISQSVTDAGGYMEQSDISGTSISDSYGHRYAYLTVRIPSDRLDQFITLVGDQANITNKSESTQDVTLQYSDIESRKKSLTIEQERLWELLEKADTLEAVIALEERLSEIRYQLESFESQLRTYDNQVDYSTVHISIDEVKVLTPTSPDSIPTRIQKGFQRNLTGVANTLVNFFVWLISSIPVFVTLAVILAAVVLLCRLAAAIGNRFHLPALSRRKWRSSQSTANQNTGNQKSDNQKSDNQSK